MSEPNRVFWTDEKDPPPLYVMARLTPEQRASLDAAEAELQRKAENDRYKIWEAGFLAGLASARGERPKNPYTWHGPTKATGATT